MKNIYNILFFLISFASLAQSSKMEAVSNITENTTGISATLKNPTPNDHYAAIEGINLTQNPYGYGIYGYAETNAIFGISVAGTGINGQSTHGTGVFGFTNTGDAGYFNANGPGNALVTQNGKVGLGTTSPTKAFLVVDGKIGAAHAIFGENTSGVAIESNYPGISFNGYWNNGRKPLSNGFVGGIGMNPSTGTISIYNTDASGTAGTNIATQDIITIKNSGFVGFVGIGNSNPQAKLHVTGGLVRIDALSGGTGLKNVLVDAQGTLTNDSPVAFSAFNVNNYPTTIASNVETTFPFSNEDYDLGSSYNNSLYEFSAPTNGIYHFDSFVTFGAVASPPLNTLFSIRFYVDGSIFSVVNEPIISGNIKTLNLSQDVKLNTGQKVQIKLIQTSGSTVQLIGSTSSRLTGRLITRL